MNTVLIHFLVQIIQMDYSEVNGASDEQLADVGPL